MFKSALFLIILSVLVVIFKTQLIWVLHGLLFIYSKISNALGTIFSGDSTGSLLRAMLALLIIPIVAGIILAVILWLFKRQSHMHILACVWVVWIVLLVTLLSQGVNIEPIKHPAVQQQATLRTDIKE